MELEHAIAGASANTAALQMLALSALLIPAAVGRNDLYGVFVSKLTSYLVSFTPGAALLYILYRLVHLT